MPSEVTWQDIAVRLALAVAAGALLGVNRSERGRAAGLRTTILVCLAAALANIQANLLLSVDGKRPDSFAVMDTLRLPLGILTGVGFIGAGTILRHKGSIQGVTTAATLWVTTMIGLCFGAGENALGGAGTVITIGTLWGLEYVEGWFRRERRATLLLFTDETGPSEDDVRGQLGAAGFQITAWTIGEARHASGRRRRLHCGVRWHAREDNFDTPALVHRLAEHPGVHKVRWKM